MQWKVDGTTVFPNIASAMDQYLNTKGSGGIGISIKIRLPFLVTFMN